MTINPTYPVYLGGYGPGPAGGTVLRHVNPLTHKAENFTVRAMSIASGGRVVEVARVDSQGWFAGYQEGPYGISDVRAAVAAFLRSHGVAGATPSDIVVSSMHEHASPTIMGVWAPPQHALPYLKQVAAAATQALEQAYLDAQPATLSWGSGNFPWIADTTIAGGNANEGWHIDGEMLALWARSVRTGATIATYVVEPGYPNIVNGDHDLIPTKPGEPAATLLSTDFPSYVQNYLEQRLGGMALVASGTLGMQPGPTQDDANLSPDLPKVTIGTNTYFQTRGFDDAMHLGKLLGNLATGVLGSAHFVRTDTLAAAQRYVLAPITGPLVAAGIDVAPADGGAPWAAAGGNSQVVYPIDRSTSPPYQVGPTVGTWVTGLRIGHLLLLSEPGEFYPSIHQAWDRSIHGAKGVFAIGMAQDQLGYLYPVDAFPSTLYSADEQIFNPSLTLGDQVVTAGEQVARALGFRANLTTTAEATATDNHYQQVTRPGVQFLPFPRTGDLSPSTGGFSSVLEGISSAPRFSASSMPHFSPSSACVPSTGLPGTPACPVARDTMGPYTWSFGDGTTGTSPPGTPQADPWFAHTYHAPGRYLVTASARDTAGASAHMSLALHVYPALVVSIVRHGRDDAAQVSGGSGHILVEHWVLPDGSSAWGPTATVVPGPGPVTVTVTDSTGTMASATGQPSGQLLANNGGVPGLGSTGPGNGPGPVVRPGAPYWVGAAKVDITPTDLTNFYLGGYGIGPVHPATGVLRPIYARAIAIRDTVGRQVVMAVIDVQGQFLAYQQGPYGFANIAQAVHTRFGIPVADIVLSSTHTHNGPDDLGVWGGVPDSYLAFVASQTEKAIATAIGTEQRSYLRWTTADLTGFCGTFGPDSDSSHRGDVARYPVDNQMRLLQAVTGAGKVTATLVNFSCHPTIYGPLGLVSPDWPGATATYLEHDEAGVPSSTPYGYPNSVALVTVGALGRTWPRGLPNGTQPALNPVPAADDNYRADHFGNSVARMAVAAMAQPRYLHSSVVGGALSGLTVANDNPLLAAFIAAPAPGYHVYRADTPPYGAGDVYTTWAVGLRIGDLAFLSAPGEPYPWIESTLAKRVNTPAVFVIGLAEDQLGYIEPASDYPSAMACSLTDEGFFTLSPLFGHELLAAQMANARALGFPVTGPGRTVGLGPGRVPPSSDCAGQVPGQVLNQLPVSPPKFP